MKLDITIYQGDTHHQLPNSDINIIIDVLRAFTTSYYAFNNGIKEILLAKTKKDVFELKQKSVNYLSSGEENAFKVEGFDFGNSPYEISNANIKHKTLIQKTTNGVKATLNALNSKDIYVTGFVNATSLIKHIHSILNNVTNRSVFKINIIASHPTGGDDLACAEYIKNLLEKPDTNQSIVNDTIQRIFYSEAAKKFIDKHNHHFLVTDLLYATAYNNSPFVMKVTQKNNLSYIEKFQIGT